MSHGEPNRHVPKYLLPCRGVPFGVFLIHHHFGDFRAKPPILGARDRKSHSKRKKSRITRKWYEIRQKFVVTTNSKPWMGFPNPPLLWLPCQRGWAKHYTAQIVSSIKQGHHHNGDQAARRPHMMYSICGRRFTTTLFGVRGDLDELIR